MPQIETGDSGKKRDGRDIDHVVTSHKVAGESISGEPMAPAYEPKFKSFSSVAKQGVDQVLHTVSQFCIEDKEKGKLITANGEKPAWEPRPSFLEGLKQAVQGHSQEEADRLQAEFSIAYMTRKATQFFQDASGSIVSGFQRCFGLANQGDQDPTTGVFGFDSNTEQPTVSNEPDSENAETHSPARAIGNADQDSAFEYLMSSRTVAGRDAGGVQASSGDIIDGVQIAKEPSQDGNSWLNKEWIQNAARKLKDKAGELKDKFYEEIGTPHQVNSVPEAVISNFRALLNSPKRDQGEFHTSIARKNDEKNKSETLMASATFFTHGFKWPGWPVGHAPGMPYQIHLSPDTQSFIKDYKVETLMHTHPRTSDKDLDPYSFDDVDKSQADAYQEQTSTTVRSFLLTPDNKLLVYVPREKQINPNGEEVGVFQSDGSFKVTNEKYKKEFSPFSKPTQTSAPQS